MVDELEDRIAGKQVPQLLLDLLNPGWRNLLVHTHLRRGTDSSEWHDQLEMIDQLWGQLSGEIDESSDEFVDPDALLKNVVEGLNSISFDPSKRTPLIMKLSSALVGDTTGKKSPVSYSDVESEAVESALGLEGLLPDSEPQLATEDEDVLSSWNTAVERAKRVIIGAHEEPAH